MAREFKFQAVLNFSFASHAELTNLRSTVQTFAANNGGTADILTNEDSDNQISYYGRVTLDLPATGRAQAASLMNAIDSALGGLPNLTKVNGSNLLYNFTEIDV